MGQWVPLLKGSFCQHQLFLFLDYTDTYCHLYSIDLFLEDRDMHEFLKEQTLGHVNSMLTVDPKVL